MEVWLHTHTAFSRGAGLGPWYLHEATGRNRHIDLDSGPRLRAKAASGELARLQYHRLHNDGLHNNELVVDTVVTFAPSWLSTGA